ncbi:enoyl-CoA hydratase/isomerase family protein [Bacillus dakarensis]|uniref:enoyl-CoA hydratase/isomerase family protein n=1 Tax=Robertmurraya dakarensis TaxID=1926278 RepID=UPI000981FF88|nr:enoyl-CoA hydratase/isomerase family protein [Bacillus dakarensis]
MKYENYQSLKIRCDRKVAFVTIDHRPINLFDTVLFKDLERFYKEVKRDDSVNIIVFESADPDFFIPHYDVKDILHLKDQFAAVPDKPGTLNAFNLLFEQYRTMPKVTIAKIAGRVGGGGSEFVLALDMRFAAVGKAFFSQPEVGLGIIPGAGGTQYLPKLVGASRALEIILGCEEFDAELAERYGWVNRALPENEIDAFVNRLAYRMASFPIDAIKLAKESVRNSSTFHLHDGLREEKNLFLKAVIDTPDAETRMKQFLEKGGQTRAVEKELGSILTELD